jgi:hypothetical protein
MLTMAEVDRLLDETLHLNIRQRPELARRPDDTDDVDGAWRTAARERLASLR